MKKSEQKRQDVHPVIGIGYAEALALLVVCCGGEDRKTRGFRSAVRVLLRDVGLVNREPAEELIRLRGEGRLTQGRAEELIRLIIKKEVP